MMDYVWCFLVGGGLCAIAQILIDKTALTPARILTSYVVAGVFLGAVGLYSPLVELAGCGEDARCRGWTAPAVRSWG